MESVTMKFQQSHIKLCVAALVMLLPGLVFSQTIKYERANYTNQLEGLDVEMNGARLWFYKKTRTVVAEYSDQGKPVRVAIDPATNLDVTVATQLYHDVDNGLLAYYYILNNKKSSVQSANTFIVLNPTPLLNTTAAEGWSAGKLRSDTGTKWTIVSNNTTGIAPGALEGSFSASVAFPLQPEALENRVERNAGTTLPGVVLSYVKGLARPLQLPVSAPGTLKNNLPGELENAVVGKVLAPVPIPEKDTALELAKRLVMYIDDGREQGWIYSLDVYGQFQRQLSLLINGLSSGVRAEAFSAMTRIMRELDAAQRYNHVTPEIEALLTYNINYIRALLKQEGPWRMATMLEVSDNKREIQRVQ
jgi:hypothetical protein